MTASPLDVPAEEPQPTTDRPALFRLYLIRGIAALAWAAGFAQFSDSLTSGAVTLLIIYPVIDTAASLVDSSRHPSTSERQLHMFNAGLSTIAAIAVGIAAAGGIPAVLHVFGAWAVISGAAQVVLALRRGGAELGRQWPLLIAGGLSFLVGVYYNLLAVGDSPTLDVLVTYATGGGGFFVVQAGLLALRLRKSRALPA